MNEAPGNKLKLGRFKIITGAFFLLIFIGSLYGCSSMREIGKGTADPPMEGRKREILSWANSEKKKVDEGAIKDSEYWKRFYRKSIELRPDLNDFLWFASEMIKVSRIFEEGKITKKQFADKQRQLTELLSEEEKRRDERLTLARMTVYENIESERFYSYRDSLFLSYVASLQKRLDEAGPQFSGSHCDFFDDTIQCTAQNPPF